MDNNNMYNQDSQNMYSQNPYNQESMNMQIQQPYQSYQNNELEEPVSFGEWMIAILLMMIPCVNIVMIFVFAFGNSKKSKSNYFKAVLVWYLIGIILSIILVAVFGTTMAALMSSMSYY